MEEGLRRVDGDLCAPGIETKTEFVALRGEMNSRFDLLQGRLEAMQRLMMQFGDVMVAALIGVIATLIATQV